jgi:hypothetical protein
METISCTGCGKAWPPGTIMCPDCGCAVDVAAIYALRNSARGKLDLTEEELDALAVILPEDVEEAKKWADREAPALSPFLNARPVGKRSKGKKGS